MDIPPEIFTEPCPPDSIEIAGTCRCEPSLCHKPDCQSNLLQITNATEIPGECCPTYACEGCPSADKINGLCPCLPGATLTLGRKCECVSPYETLQDNKCACDPNKCKLPDLCNDRSVPVSMRTDDGCCEKIDCIPCTFDSYPRVYNDTFDSKCVCFPCPTPKCNGTQRLVVLSKGKSMPGNCCDIYDCHDVDEVKECNVNGTKYSNGATWSSGDEECKCHQNGVVLCSRSPVGEVEKFRTCLSGGKVYNHLDTWQKDTCTNCTCYNGEDKCIAHMCDVHTSEVKKPDTPCVSTALLNCKKVCEFGYKLNKQGREICKCRVPEKSVLADKYNHLDSLLNQHNLTEADAFLVVKAFLAESTSSTSRTPSSTVCITEGKHSNGISFCSFSLLMERNPHKS